jgi:cation transport ATPase
MPEEDPDSRHPALDGSGSTEERQFNVAAMMVGTSMMFVGFLNVLLSISGGFEFAGVTPMLLYFAGMAIWGYAVIRNPSIRYAVMGASIIVALVFFHYGEVLFWHKQVVFWGTVILVVFFMLKTAEPNRPR